MPYQERRTTTGDGAMETPAHSITTETLLTPVRRATNRATLTIGEWFAAPVAYAKFDPVCRGVARFAGVDDLRREDWETP
jgi:hypothetical protein